MIGTEQIRIALVDAVTYCNQDTPSLLYQDTVKAKLVKLTYHPKKGFSAFVRVRNVRDGLINGMIERVRESFGSFAFRLYEEGGRLIIEERDLNYAHLGFSLDSELGKRGIKTKIKLPDKFLA